MQPDQNSRREPVYSKIVPSDTWTKAKLTDRQVSSMSRFGKFCEYIWSTIPVTDGTLETYSRWLMRWQDVLWNLYYEHVKEFKNESKNDF